MVGRYFQRCWDCSCCHCLNLLSQPVFDLGWDVLFGIQILVALKFDTCIHSEFIYEWPLSTSYSPHPPEKQPKPKPNQPPP